MHGGDDATSRTTVDLLSPIKDEGSQTNGLKPASASTRHAATAHPDPEAYSDENSDGDDDNDIDIDQDQDQDSPAIAARNGGATGKRKRPISVSYVPFIGPNTFFALDLSIRSESFPFT